MVRGEVFSDELWAVIGPVLRAGMVVAVVRGRIIGGRWRGSLAVSDRGAVA